jgi:hypothetical protein
MDGGDRGGDRISARPKREGFGQPGAYAREEVIDGPIGARTALIADDILHGFGDHLRIKGRTRMEGQLILKQAGAACSDPQGDRALGRIER